jgi:hypothetical protein
VLDLALRTKLCPDLYRILRSGRVVVRHIGFLVVKLLGPAMLVFVTDLLALGIVVVLAQVQPVDSAGRLQDQSV